MFSKINIGKKETLPIYRLRNSVSKHKSQLTEKMIYFESHSESSSDDPIQ